MSLSLILEAYLEDNIEECEDEPTKREEEVVTDLNQKVTQLNEDLMTNLSIADDCKDASEIKNLLDELVLQVCEKEVDVRNSEHGNKLSENSNGSENAVNLQTIWPFTYCKLVFSLETTEDDKKVPQTKPGWELKGTKHVYHDTISKTEIETAKKEALYLKAKAKKKAASRRKFKTENQMQVIKVEELPASDPEPAPLYDFSEEVSEFLYDNVQVKMETFDEESESLSVDTEKTVELEVAGMFTCPYCFEIFWEAKLLINHLPLHIKMENLNTDNTAKEWERKDPVANFQSSMLQCKFCAMKFANNFVLAKHEERHSAYRPFKCKKCSSRFKRRDHLTRHDLYIHSTDRQFKCAICNAAFKENRALHNHMNNAHSNLRPFKCRECCKTFKRREHLKRHIESVCTGNNFECNECHISFTRLELLDEHKRKANDIERRWKCSKCCASFLQSKSLREHESRIHLTKVEQRLENFKNKKLSTYGASEDYSNFINSMEEPIDIDAMIQPTKAEENPLIPIQKCTVKLKRCDNLLSTDNNITSKIISPANSINLGEVANTLKEKKLKIKKNKTVAHYSFPIRYESGKQRRKCPKCPKTFPDSSSVFRHLVTHTGEKPYKCDICGAPFSFESSINRHKVQVHGMDESFRQGLHQCELCNKTFVDSHKLKRHLVIHTGEKPYKCDICGAQFGFEHSVNRHKIQVHGVKTSFSQLTLHQRKLCRKTFPDSSGLKRPFVIHTEEQPYKCDICNAPFTFETSVNRHKMQVHGLKEPVPRRLHQCELCSKTFSDSKGLKRHLLIHTGEKSYKCDICGAPFAFEASVSRHKLQVHGEKESIRRRLHQCELCSKTFSDSRGLKRHLDAHSRGTVKSYFWKSTTTNAAVRNPLTLKLQRYKKNVSNAYRQVQKFSQSNEATFGMIENQNELYSMDESKTQDHQTDKKQEYSCEMCSKKFSTLTTLNRHLVSHIL